MPRPSPRPSWRRRRATTRTSRWSVLAGPSYIELGAWIGDQGLALALMGLGSALGIWGIITPQTLGIEGEEVTLDGNHPLAGQDLIFDVEVLNVRAARQDELDHGHAHPDGGHHHHGHGHHHDHDHGHKHDGECCGGHGHGGHAHEHGHEHGHGGCGCGGKH